MYYNNYPPPMRQDGPMMPQPPWQAAMSPPPQQPQNPGFTVRPVTSREEAVATPTEYFGAGVLMPDLSHGVIYLKQFDPSTGGSKFAAFAYAPAAAAVQQAPGGYDPRGDIAALREDLEALRGKVDGRKIAGKGAAE